MVTRRADDVGQSWRVMMTVSSVSSADDEVGKNGKNVEKTSKTRERPRLTPGWAFLNASGAIDGLFLVQRVPGLPQSTTCLAVRGGDAPLRSRRPASDGRASPPWQPPDPRPAPLG